MPVSQIIKTPSNHLLNAFKRAEKNILGEMAKNGENQSDAIKIRMQKALREREMKVGHAKYVDWEDSERVFELECVHEKLEVLDGFTLQYNAVMYTLQRVCGFKTRVFMLYD